MKRVLTVIFSDDNGNVGYEHTAEVVGVDGHPSNVFQGYSFRDALARMGEVLDSEFQARRRGDAVQGS